MTTITPRTGAASYTTRWDSLSPPVADPETGHARKRCCTVRTRLVPAELVALGQADRPGSPEWMDRWNARNRVEGSYGILKNPSVIGWGRNYHRYVGATREALVFAFASIAFNVHLLKSWKLCQQLTEDNDPVVPSAADDSRLPSPLPVAAMPAPGTLGRLEDPPPEPKRRGPKGLEFLAT